MESLVEVDRRDRRFEVVLREAEVVMQAQRLSWRCVPGSNR